MKILLTKFSFVIYVLVCLLPASQAEAAMISTEHVVAGMETERAALQSLLLRKDMQEKLKQNGVTTEEASKRVASLSDEEVQQVASHFDTLPVGGEPVIVISATALIIALLLYLILR